MYCNSQRVCEKEVNIMVNDMEILKGHLKNSCKGFFSSRWLRERSEVIILVDAIDIQTYLMIRIM
jgi:hypothetical protein